MKTELAIQEENRKEKYRIVKDGYERYYLMYSLDEIRGFTFHKTWKYFAGESSFTCIVNAEKRLKEYIKTKTETVKTFNEDGEVIIRDKQFKKGWVLPK